MRYLIRKWQFCGVCWWPKSTICVKGAPKSYILSIFPQFSFKFVFYYSRFMYLVNNVVSVIIKYQEWVKKSLFQKKISNFIWGRFLNMTLPCNFSLKCYIFTQYFEYFHGVLLKTIYLVKTINKTWAGTHFIQRPWRSCSNGPIMVIRK